MHKVYYKRPEIISYSHHAFPLGMIMGGENAEEWFLSNYINLYECDGNNAYNFLVEYDSNPFLDMRNIYRQEFDWIVEKCGQTEWIISNIDRNCMVEIIIDYYYFSPSIYYLKKHFMHEILIVGYTDTGDFYFWDYVKNIYKEGICKFNDIKVFDSSVLYGDGVIAKILKRRENNFDFDSELVWNQIEEYFNSTSLYRKIAINGNNENYKNVNFGIQVLNSFAQKINNKELSFLDYRYFNVFYEHEKCMRMRAVKFEVHKELMDLFKFLEGEWNQLLLIVVKYNVLEDAGRNTETVYKKINEKLERLCDLERTGIEKLLNSRRK